MMSNPTTKKREWELILSMAGMALAAVAFIVCTVIGEVDRQHDYDAMMARSAKAVPSLVQAVQVVEPSKAAVMTVVMDRYCPWAKDEPMRGYDPMTTTAAQIWKDHWSGEATRYPLAFAGAVQERCFGTG